MPRRNGKPRDFTDKWFTRKRRKKRGVERERARLRLTEGGVR